VALRPEPTGILSEARDHTVALYDEARFYTVLGPARQPRHPALFTGIARKALGGLVNTPKGGLPARLKAFYQQCGCESFWKRSGRIPQIPP